MAASMVAGPPVTGSVAEPESVGPAVVEAEPSVPVVVESVVPLSSSPPLWTSPPLWVWPDPLDGCRRRLHRRLNCPDPGTGRCIARPQRSVPARSQEERQRLRQRA